MAGEPHADIKTIQQEQRDKENQTNTKCDMQDSENIIWMAPIAQCGVVKFKFSSKHPYTSTVSNVL